jgi:hypothetical protein
MRDRGACASRNCENNEGRSGASCNNLLIGAELATNMHGRT